MIEFGKKLFNVYFDLFICPMSHLLPWRRRGLWPIPQPAPPVGTDDFGCCHVVHLSLQSVVRSPAVHFVWSDFLLCCDLLLDQSWKFFTSFTNCTAVNPFFTRRSGRTPGVTKTVEWMLAHCQTLPRHRNTTEASLMLISLTSAFPAAAQRPILFRI